MKTSSWPNGFDLSHPNWTASTSSRPTWADYDGVGGYAKGSHDIPQSSWGRAVVFVAGFVGGLYLGALEEIGYEQCNYDHGECRRRRGYEHCQLDVRP